MVTRTRSVGSVATCRCDRGRGARRRRRPSHRALRGSSPKGRRVVGRDRHEPRRHQAGRRRSASSRRTLSTRPRSTRARALIPFDANARKTLELTFREALRLGHDYVGAEQILLALSELEDGNGVLTGLGVERAATEAGIAEQLAALTGRKP